MRLPRTIDFDETAFPQLSEVFHDIDIGIAALLAVDPSLRTRETTPRRARKPVKAASPLLRPRRQRRAAA